MKLTDYVKREVTDLIEFEEGVLVDDIFFDNGTIIAHRVGDNTRLEYDLFEYMGKVEVVG